jgi:hypothetical protein
MCLIANVPVEVEMVVISRPERVSALLPVNVGTENFLTIVGNNQTHSSRSSTRYAQIAISVVKH